MTHLESLKKLTIIEQQNFALAPVGELTNLESLWIWGPTGRLDVSPIRNLTKLRHLALTGIGFGSLTAVANIEAIGDLTELRTLTLGSLQVSDLAFAASLKNVMEININQLPISSIEPLRGLKLLRKVSLNLTPVVDISPLLELPELTDLTVGRTPARSDVLAELERRGVKVTRY